MRSVKGFKLISQQLSFGFLEDFTSLKWFEWDDVSSNPSWKKFKNGIWLITIPVPIVCVFQGCVISSCWYFAQAVLRILITACLISLFFERWLSAALLWSAGDRRRHVFYFGNRAALGRNLNRLFFGRGGAGSGERGGDHLMSRRTEAKGASFVIGNPKKKSLQKN